VIDWLFGGGGQEALACKFIPHVLATTRLCFAVFVYDSLMTST
jgi:hypothetical protein